MAGILLLLLLAVTAQAFPQDTKVTIVNGNQRSISSGGEEDEPFIVVAATQTDDHGDPNEAFIPTKDDNGANRPAFNLLSKSDLAREIQNSQDFKIPTNDNGPDKPGFKLLSTEDLAREEKIPGDTSSKDESFFKSVFLPDESEEDEYSDVYVIERDDTEDEGRALDIPRDTSGPENPGFKLPLPEEPDVIIVEVGDDEEDGRSLGSEIPLDTSGQDEFGPRLPKALDDYDDVVIIEVGDDDDEVDCFEERDPGTCLNSHEAWFYDPLHNKCHFFIYSGCGGNSNRFSNEEDCLAVCKDSKKKDKCDPEGCDKGNKEDVTDRCLQAPKTGLCKAHLKYYYYNADRQACEEFTYGGCEAGSSPNKFRTEELCLSACSGVERPKIANVFYKL